MQRYSAKFSVYMRKMFKKLEPLLVSLEIKLDN